MLVAQRSAAKDEPGPEDLYAIGAIATILQMLKLPDGTVKVLVEGGQRARINEVIDVKTHFMTSVTPIAALAVAVFIFAIAGWIGWSAIREIMTPHRGPHWATLPLLAGVVAVKMWFSARMNQAGEAAGSTGLKVEALHHYSDAVTSAAAFVGIAIAVWAGPGYEMADDWAALLACGVILFNGVIMFNKALADVMDTAVSAALENEIREVALAVPGVKALDKCRVRKSGLSHLVDIQVRVVGELTVREGHDIAHAVIDALLASTRHAVSDVSVHIEPMK
jgi:cation diffusion facilitator family transporter